MKIKVNWKMFLVFFIIIGGLYYITKNVWIASAIMAILLLIDGFFARIRTKKRKAKKQAEEILKKLARGQQQG